MSQSPQSLAQDMVHKALADLAPVHEMAGLFAAAGYEFALVGGPVRDFILGREVTDLDFTTSARPPQIQEVLTAWADTVWDVGIAFGTVGVRKGDFTAEITTFRHDIYRSESRKPEVTFGDSLIEDLRRRDFTVNAMAVLLPSGELVDPHGGIADLAQRKLRTPQEPELSFADDPLRILRAARFASQLGFTPVADVVIAGTEMVDRIEIVSAERVRDEITKLLLGNDPLAGLEILVGLGLADRILPELPALQLEIDEHHRHKDVYEHSLRVLQQAIDLEKLHEPTSEPDLVLRLAALLHDIGKPKTRKFESGGGVSFHHHEMVGAKLARKRLTALRFSNEIIDEVCQLIELHLRFHGYGEGQWTDSAVRRYVRDAGSQLVRLHKLTRADCTTRNQRKALQLAATYDDLESRISVLREQEELDSLRPALDGNAIMQLLGLNPGPEVGRAYRFLMNVRLDEGELSVAEAEARLKTWWAEQPSK